MRLILLISTSLGLILLNGCAKTNHEENLDQAIGTFSRSIEVDGETREYLIYIPNSYDTIKSVPLLAKIRHRLGLLKGYDLHLYNLY